MPGKLRRRTARGTGASAEARDTTSLPLLEAACLVAQLPRALGLEQELEVAGYFEEGVVAQWRLTQDRIAERVVEAEDPLVTLRALASSSEPRLRFHVPGVIARWLADRPETALKELRPLASDNDPLVAEAVQAFGVRPQAESLGPDVLDFLLDWVRDPSEYVRRAAIEAVRPRGVWVKHLSWSVDDPAYLAPLFEELRGDHSRFVASAVGNALNDIAKKNPELVLEICARWNEEGEAGPWQDHIVRKALRSMAKVGDSRALQLLGFGTLDIVARALLQSECPAKPNAALVFELAIENRDTATKADLVYEIQTPGKVATRPRKQRFRAGTVEIPGFCTVSILIRERIFDRKAAQLIDGECAALFFLNGEHVAEVRFFLER
ncbi:MAG: HEAT repeat domain-containing protein [Planctomycetes bacterium]|nr:HEAT repeat domain-containing protein [Planctomycetota bacterium]